VLRRAGGDDQRLPSVLLLCLHLGLLRRWLEAPFAVAPHHPPPAP
jgi:hypothetical protein